MFKQAETSKTIGICLVESTKIDTSLTAYQSAIEALERLIGTYETYGALPVKPRLSDIADPYVIFKESSVNRAVDFLKKVS